MKYLVSAAFVCFFGLSFGCNGDDGEGENRGGDVEPGNTDTDTGDDDDGPSGGPALLTLSSDQCDQMMDKFVAKDCADKDNWFAIKVNYCPLMERDRALELCDSTLRRAGFSYDTAFNSALQCQEGGTAITTNEAAMVLFGIICAGTVHQPQCAGVPCSTDADCTGENVCNQATNACLDKSIECLGLPCSADSDCPTNFACEPNFAQCVPGQDPAGG